MKSSVARFCASLVLLISYAALAQVSTGTPPFGSFSSGPDVINLGNLNMHFGIPVFSKPGRGMPFFYNLGYESSVWSPVSNSGAMGWQPAANWGWRGQTDAAVGYVSYTWTTLTCFSYDDKRRERYRQYYFSVYMDEFGTPHGIGTYTDDRSTATSCFGGSDHSQTSATDPSGLTFNLTSDPSATVVKRDGTTINPPLRVGAFPATLTDRNGNQITTTGNGFTDTLGMTALSISGSAPNPQTFTYTDTSGTPRSLTVNYAPYTVQTNFGCSSVSEYGPASASLVSSVSLPDGSSYSFTYEQTPNGPTGYVTGRVASITLRTGSTITYTYTGGNNGIMCADGSTAGFTRSTSDGPTTYTRSGSGTAWTTTVVDAQSNQTFIDFQTAGSPANFYETERDVYPAHIDPVSPLQTVYTCYNLPAVAPPCNNTAITLPLTVIRKYMILNNNQQSLTAVDLNSFGLPIVVDEYDFGSATPGALLRSTVTAYASLGNGIVNLPSTVTVYDGGGNQKAKGLFNYDEAAPTPTSGVPQHVAVSGSRGNLTSMSQWLDSANSNLTSYVTYDDAGNVLTSTDPGGHQTQFTYADNFSDGVNRGSLAYLTQVTLPNTGVQHIIKAQYDANTGLTTTTWDQNNNQTTFAYDLLLRPTQVNFPDLGQTNTYYQSPTQTLVQQKIDSTRWTSAYTQLDGYGRLSRTALANGGANPYDQQDFCYDSNGRLQFQSYPYQGSGLGQPKICSGAGDSFTYDALGRTTQLAHSDGTSAQSTYSGRARQVSDEGNGNSRVSRIMQSDGLGRLISICEVSNSTVLGNGGTPGDCGLDIGGTGFLTSYAYDTNNNLTSVAQGSLTNRTYTYDSLSRLTSEREPEWGSTVETRIQSSGGTSTLKYYYHVDCPSANGAIYTDSIWVKNQGSASVQIGGNFVEGPVIQPGATQQVTFSYTGDGYGCPQLRFETLNPGDSIDVLASNPSQTKNGGANLIPAADQNFTGWSTWAGSSVTVTQIGGGAALATYAYDSDGLLLQRVRPQANQTDPAKTTTTTYAYDQLHRLTSRTYSDGTLTNYFAYDGGGWWGVPQTNTVGRLQEAWSGISCCVTGGGAIFGYDAMGRIVMNEQCMPVRCYVPVNYTYDFMGNIITSTNGENVNGPVTLTYSYDLEGRPIGVTSNFVDANHPANLLSGVQYNAFSERTSASYGNVSSNTGLGESRAFNVLGQSQSVSSWVNGGVGLEGFSGATYAPNGNMLAVNDSISYGNWTFGYDDFNRLKSSSYVSTGTSGNYTYAYDRYGNRWQQNGVNNWSQAFDNNNHILGWTYDAAGNLLNDGFHSYTYDAEGRLLTVDAGSGSATTYVYDEMGQRVERTNSSGSHGYIYDLAGRVIADESGSGWQRGEVYGGGQHVATYTSNVTYFILTDWLGNERVKSTQTGSSEQSFANLPFGDGQAFWGPSVGLAGPMGFTGDEHDSESNLEHTWFRQYSSAQGRWTTPDPYLGSIDLTNPQSMNRYAYVLNNPMSYTDPSGLACGGGDWDDCMWDRMFAAFVQGNGSCTLNGIAAPCGFVQGWVNSGVAAVCPNNDCSYRNDPGIGWHPPLKVGDDGSWQIYYPPATWTEQIGDFILYGIRNGGWSSSLGISCSPGQMPMGGYCLPTTINRFVTASGPAVKQSTPRPSPPNLNKKTNSHSYAEFLACSLPQGIENLKDATPIMAASILGAAKGYSAKKPWLVVSSYTLFVSATLVPALKTRAECNEQVGGVIPNPF